MRWSRSTSASFPARCSTASTCRSRSPGCRSTTWSATTAASAPRASASESLPRATASARDSPARRSRATRTSPETRCAATARSTSPRCGCSRMPVPSASSPRERSTESRAARARSPISPAPTRSRRSTSPKRFSIAAWSGWGRPRELGNLYSLGHFELRDRVAVEKYSELFGRELQPGPKRTEIAVSRARLVEAHLIHELFEDHRIVGVKIDAPFEVVEADRARDHLRHAPVIRAPHDAVLAHHLRARLVAQNVPILHLAAPLAHRIEALVTAHRDLRP